MIHTCGADFPADVAAYVEHVAGCPDSGAEIGAWCRAIVSLVTAEALAETPETPTETPTVSPETPTETRETPSETRETASETPRDTTPLTTARMAELRDSGMSLRDLAVLADIAPETVRRRIARHRAGGDS